MSAPVPATVATYDAVTRSGTVLREDGHRLAFDGAALDPAVRLLRSGALQHGTFSGVLAADGLPYNTQFARPFDILAE